MFHQPNQVRSRWNHRSTQLFVVEPIQLPQHDVAMVVEVGAQIIFLVAGERHSFSHAQILFYRVQRRGCAAVTLSPLQRMPVRREVLGGCHLAGITPVLAGGHRLTLRKGELMRNPGHPGE